MNQTQMHEFAQKLRTFSHSLTDHEKEFLRDLLAHAAVVDGRTVGFQAGDFDDFLTQVQHSYAHEASAPAAHTVGTFFGR